MLKKIKLILPIFFIAVGSLSRIIANDKPLMIYLNKRVLFPVFQVYSEREFGGSMMIEPRYDDDWIIEFFKDNNALVIRAPIPYSPSYVDYKILTSLPSPPNSRHLLGTDDKGRDILSILIYGCANMLLFGISVAICASILGSIIGCFQGYFGGVIDFIGQRFNEIWSSLPLFYILIMMSDRVTNVVPIFILAVCLEWPLVARMIRLDSLRIRSEDYVSYARIIGKSSYSIITDHLIPNTAQYIIAKIPFMTMDAISLFAMLSFIGINIGNNVNVGELLIQAKDHPEALWIGVSAILFLSMILSSMLMTRNSLSEFFEKRINRIHFSVQNDKNVLNS